MQAELRDLATGLWVWRVTHPAWGSQAGWEPLVASTCVESGGEVALLDPIAPPEDSGELWDRLDARPPTMLVVLKPDHVRDVDLFARRYGARAFGRGCSGATTSPRSTSSRSNPAASCPAGSSPSTTAGVATRRRSGCPSSEPSCSPMR